ncbi:DUF2842 domain-containing protein [Sedimentitalea sp. CY04]|uniref:DUF2842 domain-containing protein n=1 Tax=Parasedimentitalea denitrificans TaxID=2211118 RepID=A0ABX0W6Q6_9RHOB|nr:DUF2842 domain-containing protein [Sedimentitalea sp. CY04]NIZ61330.1 DUF2842 domain-containing protein [Sedimentitalea sp. CY04]
MADKKGLSYKARRRWALVVLLIGLPLYIMVATVLGGLLVDYPVVLQLLVFVVLGIIWILPFKSLFRGIGQADPDAPKDE